MVIRNPDEFVYPCTDGKPIAENTIQYRWITTIKGGMDVVFKDAPNVFVAGDLLWYPVQGEPEVRAAPDTMVVVGRPKGERLSYLQWKEDDIPPQVVFEVLSPGNSRAEMVAKHDFYETHGVDEYYIYDPDHLTLEGWIRRGTVLRRIHQIDQGWTSPRTKVLMRLQPDLVLIGPDGKRFVDYPVLVEQRDEFERRAEAEAQAHRLARERADSEIRLREQAESRLEDERRRAKEARRLANEASQRADTERQQRETVEQESRQAKDELEALRQLLKSREIDPDSLK
jgi:Uma2 family endonuclease